MKEIRLAQKDVRSALAIQRAIDALGTDGGRVILPELELELDRGLALRSNVELVGQGQATILRKARGRVYPLAGYHNYGMYDVPLEHTGGLEPGMTVAVRDNVHGGFFETFARITWVEDTWVGLDRGLDSDYRANQDPVLVTSFPLIYGLGVENVAVRDLSLDGNRAEQPAGIGACRGAAVYFCRSHHFEVSGVEEKDFFGEGLGFQMCSHVQIRDCRFTHNTGNGYHPGAGSTVASFTNCVAERNGAAGFFFCVRANHVTVRGSTFTSNHVCGISIGTRDCYNRIEGCRITDNDGPGILVRPTPRPTEVHSCRIAGCQVAANARQSGRGQIDIQGDAHDLILEGNAIVGLADIEKAGIYGAPSTERIWLDDNRIEACFPPIILDPASRASKIPSFTCGMQEAEAVHWRHLIKSQSDV